MKLRFAVSLLALIAGPTLGDDPAGGRNSTPNILHLEEGAESPPATIDQVAWLAGNWRGAGLGGTVQETWSGPDGRAMMGMFRLVKEEKVVFYEFFTISEEKGSLVVRLKHFEPDLKGWEEKDRYIRYPLVRLEGTAAYFDGLTYRRTGVNSLEVFVSRRRKDGTLGEIEFQYGLAPSSP